MLLVGMLTLAFNVKLLRASGTIYIRADGSIDPPDAPILRDGDFYTFLDNIFGEIVVERDSIIIDGAGYNLEGTGIGNGISLEGRKYVTIRNMAIRVFEIGIYLEASSICQIFMTNISVTFDSGILLNSSSGNNVSGSNIQFNRGFAAISLYKEPWVDEPSNNNSISGNNITNNDGEGIYLSDSSNNELALNNIANNGDVGILLLESNDNSIIGNNITNNLSDGILLYGYSSNNSIIGNKITNSTGCGIHLDEFSADNNIAVNNVTSNFYQGILIERISNNIHLSENYIKNNGKQGIYVQNSKNMILSRNIVAHNSDDGIYLHNSDNSTLTTNIVTYNGDSGIVVFYSDNSILSANTAAHNAHGGIAVGGSNNTLSGNSATDNGAGGISCGGANCNVSANIVFQNAHSGIYFGCEDSVLCGNFATNNTFSGIELYSEASKNDVYGNLIVHHTQVPWVSSGITLYDSLDNRIYENNIVHNSNGVYVDEESHGNVIYHNNFLNNEVQVVQNCMNYWDNGPSDGGNYWSDYEGGELPHHKDRYPFIVPLGPIPVFHKETRYDCIIDGNMTVSRFNMDENKAIGFNINGQGYVNLTIPRTMLDGSFKVFIDNTQTPYKALWNTTCNFIYLEHTTSIPVNVEIEAQVKLQGDLNGDGKVNIKDISIVAKHFGQELQDP